jgi:DNA-binding NarL/FixJ family response regulator/tetratricopeptide (TPR) repeat protein
VRVDLLTRGAALLAEGDWQAAKDTLGQAGDAPEALSGLGEALFWLGDIPRALALRERAYVAFREGGNKSSAARMALWLATEHTVVGNDAVGNGWLGRADRLIGELGACVERGWLLLCHSRRSPDPKAAEPLAREALELAQTLGDRELEIAAISQRGRSLLATGQTQQGFACLDEAMAAATSGEIRSPNTITNTCCDMIGACERTMELERATQWCQVTDEYARRYTFLPLFAFCRATYAGVLLAVGRWTDADRELCEALRAYQASLPSQSSLALAKLAELRLLQGRDAEAEALLAKDLHSPVATKAVAMLYLARGDAPQAARLLATRLAVVQNDVLVAAPLLLLLVEAHLAGRNIAAAARAVAPLDVIAATTRRAAFVASAAYASGLVRSAKHDRSAAAAFEVAIDAYASAGMLLPGARARLALARCLAADDPRAAKELCRTAVAILAELGAQRDLDANADLRRRLGVGARIGPRMSGKLTRREEEVLPLLALGLTNAKIGARLFISPKTVEHHVGHILEKLGLETRAAAAAHAARTPPKKPATK